MQFTMEAWSGIADGSITLTFRTWSKARVKVGNTYQIAPGVVRVTRVEQVTAGSITDDDAIRTGADLGSLRDRLGVEDDHLVWRIEFEFAGEDPRVALRSAVPDGEELDSLVDELMAMDRRATAGPWVRKSLQLIADNPGVRAPDLAPQLSMDVQPFKTRIRRLKAMGLTESLRIGYRLSPRGEAAVRAMEESG